MINTLLLLAFVLPVPLFGRRGGEQTDATAMKELRQVFAAMNISVTGDHPRCREPNLYGLYVRGSRQVVVCPRGDQSDTLRHEGWHAVQSLCLSGRPWLSRETIEQRLTGTARSELQAFVTANRWQREAEARVIASLKVNAYRVELEKACGLTDAQASS